jgi:hypothetical protein
VEGFGFWDFVAVEQACGHVGDEVVPTVSVDVGEVLDAVAVVAGERGQGRRMKAEGRRGRQRGIGI